MELRERSYASGITRIFRLESDIGDENGAAKTRPGRRGRPALAEAPKSQIPANSSTWRLRLPVARPIDGPSLAVGIKRARTVQSKSARGTQPPVPAAGRSSVSPARGSSGAVAWAVDVPDEPRASADPPLAQFLAYISVAFVGRLALGR